MTSLRIIPAGLLIALAATAQIPEDAAPVTLDGRTLYEVKIAVGTDSAAQRAARQTEAIEKLARTTSMKPDELRILRTSEGVLVAARGILLFGISDAEAKAEGKPSEELVRDRIAAVRAAIVEYRRAREPGAMIRSSLLLLFTLAFWGGALFVLLRGYAKLREWFDGHYQDFFRNHAMTGIFALLGRPLMMAASGALRLGAFVIGAILTFSALSYALSLFPATAPYAHLVYERVFAALAHVGSAVADYMPNLAVLIVIGILTYYLLRFARTLATGISSGLIVIQGFHRDWARPTADLVSVLLVMFALVVSFPYLPGGDSPALKGVSIFFGVLLSLGSGSAMGNGISGVILTYMRPFQVGDRVKIADTVGDVLGRSLLVTRIRTIKNVEIIIPNSMVLGAHILNYSAQAADQGLILNTTVTIGYDAPWRQVHELMIAAALKTPGIVSDPKPFVFQTALNDFNVSYEINAYTREPCRMQVIYSDLHHNIQDEFNQAGVEIMSPNYFALRDGNQVTIPKQDLPPAYEAPDFRVRVAKNDDPS